MLWLVVPVFADMFKDMGAELPGMTQFVVDASDFIVHYGLYFVGGIVAIVLAFRKYHEDGTGAAAGGRHRPGPSPDRRPDRAIRDVPLRHEFRLAAEERHPHARDPQRLGEHLPHQPDLPRCAWRGPASRVAAGRPLATSLEETGLFTTMMTNMVRIGEQSGQLALVVEQIAPYYKEKMEGLIASVTKLMEPIIIMGMGVTIAGLMMSIYMPMFEMAGKVK